MKERKLCFDLDTRHTRENATNLFLLLQFSFANRNKENERTMHGLGAKKNEEEVSFFAFANQKKFLCFVSGKNERFLISLCRYYIATLWRSLKKDWCRFFFGSKATNIGNTKEGKMDCRVKQNKNNISSLSFKEDPSEYEMKWNMQRGPGGWTPTDEKIIHFIFYGSFPTRENVINKVFCWLTNICDSTRI